MKKIALAVFTFLLFGSVYAASTLPPHADINFTLSNIESGTCPAIVQNAKVVVDYDYDFELNMGLAYLRKFETVTWGEVLHPMGISSYYGFISDMEPKTLQLSTGDVTVYRVIFHLHNNGDSQVTMMIGEDGDCLMTSNIVNILNQK